MAMRRIAMEEAFVTPEIMAQWHVVLAGRDVEPGFAKMGETILAQTPANKPLDDRPARHRRRPYRSHGFDRHRRACPLAHVAGRAGVRRAAGDTTGRGIE